MRGLNPLSGKIAEARARPRQQHATGTDTSTGDKVRPELLGCCLDISPT